MSFAPPWRQWQKKGCLMCVSVRELHKDLWEGGMMMDLLMMWPLPVWIRAVMLSCPHEYSEALSLKDRWMLKVTLEGNKEQHSRVYSAFRSFPSSAKSQWKNLRIKAKLNRDLLLNYDENNVFYVCMSSLEALRASFWIWHLRIKTTSVLFFPFSFWIGPLVLLKIFFFCECYTNNKWI